MLALALSQFIVCLDYNHGAFSLHVIFEISDLDAAHPSKVLAQILIVYSRVEHRLVEVAADR